MSEDFNYNEHYKEPGLGLTPDDFPTHLSAAQLKAHWQPWESPGNRLRADWEPDEEDIEDFWDRKLMGSQMRKHGKHSLYESIRKKGVLDPVQVSLYNTGPLGFGYPMITGGHHRIAVMGALDPDKPIPVEHREFPDYNWEDD